ncbi:MAG: phosphoglycerate kinase [bacterium]
MKKIKSIESLKGKLENKVVLVRVDYNVPLKNGKVKEDYKITTSLPTINFLIEQGAKIILMSHLGDPGGKVDKKLSLLPVAERLGKLTKIKIKFLDTLNHKTIKHLSTKLVKGEVVLLENLRFNAGEEKNDQVFAKSLASFASIYVNNAFAVSHRAHASVSAIKKYLPSYAGLLLFDEIDSLEKALNPKQPLVVLMGGAKVKTKLPIIKKFLPVADHILLGGVIANDVLKLLDFEVGKSMTSGDSVAGMELVKLYKKAGNHKIILPMDFVVSEHKNGSGKVVVKKVGAIGKKDYIFDIGPETVSFYARFIKRANTLVWNGPMGWFENPDFRHGTMALTRYLASLSKGAAFGVAGGGETVEALKLSKMFDDVDWVSTAGGAMLEYLSGAKLPGLDKIVK